MNTLNLMTRATAVLALSAAAFAVAAQQAPDRATTEAAFVRADANKDGLLSKDEAAKLPAIAAKFAQLDANKDGMLNPEEFAAGYTAPN